MEGGKGGVGGERAGGLLSHTDKRARVLIFCSSRTDAPEVGGGAQHALGINQAKQNKTPQT